jgi:hypothetical protein
MYQRTLLSLLAPFAFAACGVGTLSGPTGGGDDMMGGDDDIVAAADATPITVEYSLAVTPAIGEINLGEQMSFTATVSSENFAGPVTLDLAGALADWDVTYEPFQTLSLAENQSIDVIVTVTVPTNGTAGAGALAFNLDGELGTRNANSTMTVADRVRIAIIPGNGGGLPLLDVNGDVPVRVGTELVIANEDTSPHRIHSDPHQGAPMNQGESYIMYINDPGRVDTYCHDDTCTGRFDFVAE